MNISEMHAIDFGAWHDLTLDRLGAGATVFYGPNEAGKTTLLNLIRTVLYGFSAKRCERYLPPASGHQAGGWLCVTDVSGTFRIHRTAPAHYEGGAGTLRVQAESGGETYGNELLTSLLAGIDETIFNNVFAVGLTQMQQLATLSDTEAANQLYGLATGVDRVSLFDVRRELTARRSFYLAADTQSTGRLDDLLEIRKRLDKELKALQRDAGHFAKLRSEYRELRQSIQQQEAAQKLLDGKGPWDETSAAVREQWSRCVELHGSLRRMGAMVDVPDHMAKRVLASRKQLADRRREWVAVRDQRRQLGEKAKRLKGRDLLYPYAAEIEALHRQRPRIATLEGELKQQQATLDELEFELQTQLEGLGLQAGVAAGKMPVITDELLVALREPARETRELKRVADTYKEMAETHRKEAGALKSKLDSASLRRGGEPIEKGLQRAVSLVQNLERRVRLDETREDMIRRLDELEADAHYWRQRTVLPWNGVLTACGVFSVGVMLLLTGLLNNWFDLADALRLPMMTIGGSLAVISLVIKGAFEHSAEDRADVCSKQLATLHEEQERTRRESLELDRVLPADSGNLDQRLQDARKELAEWDQFAPLQKRQQELLREADALEHQATLATRQMKEARRAWKAALRSVGLPDSLTPSHLGQMTHKVGDMNRLRQRIEEARRDVDDRRQALAAIRDRVQTLLNLGEIHEAIEGVDAQLARLVHEQEKHSKAGRQRAELRGQWDQLKVKQDQIAAAAGQILRNRRQLLNGIGLTHIADFRRALARARKAATMREERDTLLAKIHELLGNAFPVKKLTTLMDGREHELVEYLAELDQNRESVGNELATLYERSGEVKQRLDGYMQDRRCERKQLEILAVDEQIRQASEGWRHAAYVSAILDQIKENYETKRQPVALAEASRHLDRLTEGRYVRIWTPMGQNALCVDDHRRQPLSVGKLSRGTRELVYLALRLALVSSYHRRGANMPIVLDDVFVNFDDQRARSTASVLVDLAQAGQQLLIFTCHKRIQQIFSDLGCDVRDLPLRTRGEATKPSAPQSPDEKGATQSAVEVTTQPAISTVAADLPVYDAVSWDQAVEKLALPVAPSLPAAVSEGPPPASRTVLQPAVQHDFSEDQFQPAWRDENLEPLPDLVADDVDA